MQCPESLLCAISGFASGPCVIGTYGSLESTPEAIYPRSVNVSLFARAGAVKYRVTKECLDERLATDVEAAARSIDKTVRVLTVHGTTDETIPVQDGKLFDSVIPNHKLVLVEGADHRYSKHREELNEVVSNFISSRPQSEPLHNNLTAG